MDLILANWKFPPSCLSCLATFFHVSRPVKSFVQGRSVPWVSGCGKLNFALPARAITPRQ